MLKRKLLQNIEDAFNCQPNGDIIEIDNENYQEVIEIFANKRWKDIDSSSLFFSQDLIRALSTKAFSYYIAAYLKIFICDYEQADALIDTILNMLTPPLSNGSVRTSWVERELFYFTKIQKTVIASTLSFLAKEYQHTGAQYALEIYWENFLPLDI